MVPHFVGNSNVRVHLEETHAYKGDSPFEGCFEAMNAPVDSSEGAAAEYPILFIAPDMDQQAVEPFPRDASVQIAALAEAVKVFEDRDEYDDSQELLKDTLILGKPIRIAPRSFFPLGLMPKDPEAAPLPFAGLSGYVKSTEARENPITGVRLRWVLAESIGATYDLVAREETFTRTPVEGEIVAVDRAWLSGRILDGPYQPRWVPL